MFQSFKLLLYDFDLYLGGFSVFEFIDKVICVFWYYLYGLMSLRVKKWFSCYVFYKTVHYAHKLLAESVSSLISMVAFSRH